MTASSTFTPAKETAPAYNKSQFLHNFHNFRTVAIIGIVAAHALHNLGYNEDSFSYRFIDTLFNESSIWFIFIAGMLFSHLSTNFSYKKFIKIKLRNVILPYLILSIPAIIASLTFFDQGMPDSFDQMSVFEQTSILLLTGKHLAPFWFVPVVAIFYSLAKFIIKIDALVWPYVALPALLLLSGIYGRDGFLIATGLNGYYSTISKFLYLFPIYMLGVAYCRYYNEIFRFLAKYHLLLLFLTIASFLMQIFYANNIINYQFIFKLITCITLPFYLSFLWLDGFKKIRIIGTVSFGIFFIHAYFLAATKIVMEEITGSALFPPNAVLFLAYTILVIGICISSILIHQKIFGERSRMIIGA